MALEEEDWRSLKPMLKEGENGGVRMMNGEFPSGGVGGRGVNF